MWKALAEYGMSEESVKLLLSSCSASTQKHYASALSKWIINCKESKVDPLNANIANIVDYLVKLFKSGLGYSSLNTVRSALSLVVKPIDGNSVGSHKLVNRFFKTVFKLAPPKRKYETIWNAESILNLYCSWEVNENLKLKFLTLKLISLLALISGQRMQTLSLIELNNIKIDSGKVTIFVPQNIKTSKLGVSQPSIVFCAFPNEEKLCPVNTLVRYMNVTSSIRNSVRLFVSFEKPHKEVCVQSISRWLKMVLKEAGIDISMYSGHSYRHASTSKALACGVNTDVIFSSAGWCDNSSVFAKFYKCKVDNRCSYSQSILS